MEEGIKSKKEMLKNFDDHTKMVLQYICDASMVAYTMFDSFCSSADKVDRSIIRRYFNENS